MSSNTLQPQQPEQQLEQQQQPAAAAAAAISHNNLDDDRPKNSSARLIRRYPKSNGTVPFIKFGPLFGQDEDFVKKAKEDAWQHVVSSSKSREAAVIEIYMSSLRQIENKAKASYDPDPVLDKLSNKDFRDTMLKDSCLFLQLSFSLLHGDDKLDAFPHLRNISLSNRHKWVESMFHVGNQIPLVVLRVLLKKRYFQEVVKNGKWKEPSSDLAKMALFRLLLSPALDKPQRRIKVPSVRKHARRLMHWTQQLKECSDVLHGLHLLLLGPEIDPEKEEYDDDDVDLEEKNIGPDDKNGDTNNAQAGGSGCPECGGAARDKAQKEDDNDDDKKLKNAIKLKQAGVHFRVTKEGIRGIRFKSSLIYPKLSLPQLFVGSHTRLLLECLKQYEQKLDPSLQEVSSYLQFMHDLVRTAQDAKILVSNGIIKGNRKYTQKLPAIFIDLAPNDKITDTSLSPVKIEINSFYRPPWVSNYFTIVFVLSLIGLLVSIAQLVYAVLAYHKPPS
ncbi:uncharacterized protein LOC132029358 [Lycium ferocissimum]|uniref:uncharacterized protein LOC132029358 n=1 Tax=Lycium ferocissimum TaxID=112874 RepID=UPI002814DD08|nr:uncharacterized protein LOC132029358 [Lycium ferocissimum]